jgi:hypothetical protein
LKDQRRDRKERQNISTATGRERQSFPGSKNTKQRRAPLIHLWLSAASKASGSLCFCLHLLKSVILRGFLIRFPGSDACGKWL